VSSDHPAPPGANRITPLRFIVGFGVVSALADMVRVDAKGQGYIRIYVSDMPNSKVTYHLSTIQPVDYQSTYRSASWKVTSDDILVDSGTYASCQPGQVRIQP
jgi:hypothetical protein